MQDTIILSANAQRTIAVAGKYFTVIASTAPFTIELDGQQRRSVNVGNRITSEAFKRITFFETSGAANTITFDASTEPYQGDVSVLQQDADSTVIGASGAGGVAADGTLRDVPANPTTRRAKGVLLTAVQSGGDVNIFDTTGNLIGTIQSAAPTSFYPTDSPLKYKARAGAGTLIVAYIVYNQGNT